MSAMVVAYGCMVFRCFQPSCLFFLGFFAVTEAIVEFVWKNLVTHFADVRHKCVQKLNSRSATSTTTRHFNVSSSSFCAAAALNMLAAVGFYLTWPWFADNFTIYYITPVSDSERDANPWSFCGMVRIYNPTQTLGCSAL